MKSYALWLMLGMVPLLGGCATARAVYLRDANGNMAQCGPYTKLGNIPMEDEAVEIKMRSCVSKLELQGYERIASP
jgi:hypothetical protein